MFIFTVSCKRETNQFQEVYTYNAEEVRVILANAISVELIGEPSISSVQTIEPNRDTIITTTVKSWYRVIVGLDDNNRLIPPGNLNEDEVARMQGRPPIIVGRACGYACKRTAPWSGGDLCPNATGCEAQQPSGCGPVDCGSECTLIQDCLEEPTFGFKFGGRIIF